LLLALTYGAGPAEALFEAEALEVLGEAQDQRVVAIVGLK